MKYLYLSQLNELIYKTKKQIEDNDEFKPMLEFQLKILMSMVSEGHYKGGKHAKQKS